MHWCIDCMSSVYPSAVTLVYQDHTGWKSWKLITRTISPTPSLFVAQRASTYSQGNMGKFGETRGRVGKSGMLEQKSGNISETRKDSGKVRKSQMLFRTVPSPTPYDFLFPNIGFVTHKTSIAVISGKGKATDFKFGFKFRRFMRTQAP